MVVVVPTLPHGQQRNPGQVAPLHGHRRKTHWLAAMVVCKVAHQPMPDDSGRDSRAQAPPHKRPAPETPEWHGGEQHLEPPGALHQLQQRLMRRCGQRRWPWQPQFAMQLPPSVYPKRPTMAKKGVTVGLPLSQVAQVMLTLQTQRAIEPDLDATGDQGQRQPTGASKAVVNQLAVAAKGMAEQQNQQAQSDEHHHRRPAERERAADHRASEHRGDPQGLGRRPKHIASPNVARVSHSSSRSAPSQTPAPPPAVRNASRCSAR
mmetsp:Transcript_15314/g.36488  ORF Transcript_15314/g.36488 Transcript_15314/m.36488 type:complete len:263 (-) Transcript_15314:363-1151(-)